MSVETIYLDPGSPVVFGGCADLGDLAESTWHIGVGQTGTRVFLVPAYDTPKNRVHELSTVRELTGAALKYYHQCAKTVLGPIMEIRYFFSFFPS
ncbi:hypothetical protein FJZ22_02820 [Candidatus Pacearchaeota archaeon]|nr:hypothetical protein [Candidatus Pacearchaeota archaeon]